MTVSQYRNNILREYLGLRTDGAKDLFVKKLNNDIAYTIAYSRGFFDDAIIQKGVDSLTNDIYPVHKDLTEYGYAMTLIIPALLQMKKPKECWLTQHQ
jgi:hypothetical protein